MFVLININNIVILCRHLKLPFHWQIMKPNLQSLFPGETPDLLTIQHHVDTDGVFSISPDKGILAPAQEHRFLITYSPKDVCGLTYKHKQMCIVYKYL